MEIYIGLLILIFCFSLAELSLKLSSFQNKTIIFILYSLLVFLVGFRWETGVDWNSYLFNFNSSDNFGVILLNSLIGYELGYGILVYLVRIFTNSYSVFLVFHSLIFYFGLFHYAKKYSPFFFITILLYFSTNLGLVGANRQLLALVICLSSLRFVFEKKPLKFFLVIFLASFFHLSSLFFLVYYFLDKDFKKETIFITLTFAFLIGLTDFPVLVFTKIGENFGALASSKILSYNDSMNEVLAVNKLSLLGVVRRAVFLIIFTFGYNTLSNKIKYYKLSYNGYIIGIIIFLLFSKSLLIIVNRGALYFNIMECALISSQFILFKKRNDRIILLIVLLLFSIPLLYKSISAYPDLFIPYKSVFYNSDFYRELY